MASSAEIAIETWSIDRVAAYGGNPRRILPVAIDKVAASLRRFGWRQPLVVEPDGTLIAGHVRLAAAKLLGHATVPVHVATGLSADEIRAYRLADNRCHEEVTWDDGLLTQELQAITDADLRAVTGFDEGELVRLVGELTVPEATAEEQGRLDERATVICPACGHQFHA